MKKLIVFTAPWCGPCSMMYPIIQKLADYSKGSIKIEKVNMDKDPCLAMKYGVRSIPAFVLIDDDGNFDSLKVGAMTSQELSRFALA